MRTHLPNAPLAEVVCEARFPGDLSLLSKWGAVQDAIRKDFPRLYVPAPSLTTSPLVQSLRLSTEDERESVLLAINSFAYSLRRYHTFEDFRKRFLAIHHRFCAAVGDRDSTRFGLRYMNFLPPSSMTIDGRAPTPRPLGEALHPLLKLTLGGAPVLSNPSVNQTQVVAERVVNNLVLRVAIVSPATAPQQIPGVGTVRLQAGVQLDLDCYTEERGRVGSMAGFLESAHEVVEDAFFSMVTPEYMEIMRGFTEEKPT
jgi:uncharacterized protein (TIGR04255 family)